jgi:hypothetical protein
MRQSSSGIRRLFQFSLGLSRASSTLTRFLLSLWLLFFLLVELGIHGSSLPLTARWWAPEITYQGYVADYLPGAFDFNFHIGRKYQPECRGPGQY